MAVRAVAGADPATNQPRRHKNDHRLPDYSTVVNSILTSVNQRRWNVGVTRVDFDSLTSGLPLVAHAAARGAILVIGLATNCPPTRFEPSADRFVPCTGPTSATSSCWSIGSRFFRYFAAIWRNPCADAEQLQQGPGNGHAPGADSAAAAGGQGRPQRGLAGVAGRPRRPSGKPGCTRISRAGSPIGGS